MSRWLPAFVTDTVYPAIATLGAAAQRFSEPAYSDDDDSDRDSDDDGNGAPVPANPFRREGSRARRQSEAIRERATIAAKRLLYRKEFAVPISSAGTTGSGSYDSKTSASLRYDAQAQTDSAFGIIASTTIGSGTAATSTAEPHRNGFYETELLVPFNTLLTAENLAGNIRDVDIDTIYIDHGRRAMIVEVSLVIFDELWKTGNVYLIAELDRVVPMHSVTHVFGDHQDVLKRCALPPRIPKMRPGGGGGSGSDDGGAERHQDSVSSQQNTYADKCDADSMGVDGWCLQCGLKPNMLTLYQTPLSDLRLINYAYEICAKNGTHTHVQRATREDGMLEIDWNSEIARDVAHHNSHDVVVEPPVGGVPSNTIFVQREAWQRQIEEARSKVLQNLPLSDTDVARLKLRARGIPSLIGSKLRVVVTVQCIEFKTTDE